MGKPGLRLELARNERVRARGRRPVVAVQAQDPGVVEAQAVGFVKPENLDARGGGSGLEDLLEANPFQP